MHRIVLVLPKQSWRQDLGADTLFGKWSQAAGVRQRKDKSQTKDASKGSHCDGPWGSLPPGPYEEHVEPPTPPGLCTRGGGAVRLLFSDPEPSLVGGCLGHWSLQDVAQTSLVPEKAKNLVPGWDLLGTRDAHVLSGEQGGGGGDMDGALQPLPCQVSALRLHDTWEPRKSCVWPGKAQGRCDQADGSSSSCHHAKRASERREGPAREWRHRPGFSLLIWCLQGLWLGKSPKVCKL